MGERVSLEGATNFRDLGGYRTADGRHVRIGRVFRSDALHRLTDRDHAVLAALNVRLVCDLRYGEERAAEPSRLPLDSPIEALHIGLPERPDPRFADALDQRARDERAALAYLTGNYQQYPILYAPAYAALLRRLLALEQGALVFHCTAGKDRAGFAAAVLLLTLGVPHETVLADYLRTNELWDRAGRVPADWPAPVVEAIFTAREEYLSAGLGVIESRYGSFDAYLSEAVGFTGEERERLRDKLLES